MNLFRKDEEIYVSKGKKGLGRGLGALIPEVTTEAQDGNLEVDIQKVFPNKNQPRKEFDEAKLQELSDSISQHGVIQPLIVSKEDNGYQIVAGERRWRAAMMAGVETIPVIVKDATDEELMEISLIENLQREDLNVLEEAIAYKQLMERYNMTQNDISSRLGKSRVSISNTMRLLKLSEKIQSKLKENVITAGHARAILSIKPNLRDQFAEKIISEKMSVRQAEKYSSKISENNGKKIKSKKKEITDKDRQDSSLLADIEERIQKHIGTKVKIKHKNSKGKIEIEYYSDDDLERIVNVLTK